jgi:TPR repeat protein
VPNPHEVLAHVYEHRASQGDPQAAYDLAYLYNAGLGVDKNLPEAFEWYLKSAKGGLIAAQEKVALFHSVGNGVTKSDKGAYFWILIARI